MEYVKKNWQNTPSTNTPINADNLNHIEQGIYDAQSTANAAQELASETEAKLDALQARETTSTAAGMTDTTKAYIYTGSEAGYNYGHWYYWNGSAWTDGGVYNSAGVNTDTTLSVSGAPADSKATGDEVTNLKSALSELEEQGYIDIPITTETGYFNGSGVNSYDTDVKYRRTQYIDVTNVTNIVVSYEVGVSALVFAEYDENKAIIGERQSITTPQTITPSATAKYIRIAGYNATELTEAKLLAGIVVYYDPNYFQTMRSDVDKLILTNSTDSLVSTFYQGGFTGSGQGRSVSQLTLSSDTNRIRSLNANTGVSDTIKLNANTKYKCYVDDGYNYMYQVYSMATGLSLDVVADFTELPTEILKTEDVGFIVKVGKRDNSNIIPSEGSHFHIEAWNGIKEDVQDLQTSVKRLAEVVSDSVVIKPVFNNQFDKNSLLSLPSGFSSFPFSLAISKYNDSYGYTLAIDKMKRSNGVTYYVGLDGDDTNTGLTPSDKLLTLTEAISKEDVETIIISEGEYVKGTHFTSTPIQKELNIIGLGNVVFNANGNVDPLKVQAGCYFKNIIFKSGNSNISLTLEDDLCVFEDCQFINALSVNGFDCYGGQILLIRCYVHGSARDGFFYKKNGTYYPQVIEIECYGDNCGNDYNSYTNNCSTCHDADSHIIRIGCAYQTSKGVPLADADACKSINIQCIVNSSIAIGSDTRNGNYGGFGADMWLYDCDSFGSEYDAIADMSATVYTTRTYTSELELNGGHVTHLT